VLFLSSLGVFFYLSSAGHYLEEEVGLNWHFKLRGSIAPPSDVVIVSIDQDSANILHFPDDPENWPRSYYSELIKKINRQKPAVIAFNLHFSESRDQTDDLKLAEAMLTEKNVILSSYLKQDSTSEASPIGNIRHESVIEPIALLTHAAISTAPFPLPKTSSTVKEFWTHSSGGMTTFPTSIFQYFVLYSTYPEMVQIISKIDPVLFANLPPTFGQFKQQPNAIEIFDDIQMAFLKDETSIHQTEKLLTNGRYLPKIGQLLKSWLSLLKSEDKLYLNHYGDVGAITTIPFYKVLAADNQDTGWFKDKIVLVGYSDDIEPEKYQGFYTVFSQASGKVISPIEIAATAVANTIEQSWLRPLSMNYGALLILVWGIALSSIYLLLPFKYSILTTLLVTVSYCGYSHYAFASQSNWLPLATPMLQAVIAILWQATIHLFRLRTVSGSHLPKRVIDEITRTGKINQEGISMVGVCMATDIDHYTTLSEELGSRQIAKLINDYNDVIYPKISSKKGLILNNIGDAILAGWVSENIDSKLRRDACLAALEIKSAIDSFNQASKHPLMTRIGLHFGEMEMGFVGAKGRYEYRAVGDTVNTSTRIEGLNKILGTRILVSAPVLENLPGFFSREIGCFLLKGRLQPVTVIELMGTSAEIQDTQPHLMELTALFANALNLCKQAQWQQALDAFNEINKSYPNDGPSQFYQSYLQNRLLLIPEQCVEGILTLTIDVDNISKVLH